MVKPAASSGKAKELVAKKKPEKRAKRYRATCPESLRARLLRAQGQRLYLVQQSNIPACAASNDASVDFTVLGSTGNVYTVTLTSVPFCNCPDYQRRHDSCKHLLFVLLKVIGLAINDPLSYQKAYLTSELEVLFEKLRTRRVGGTVLANAHVRAAVAGETRPDADDLESSSKRRSLEDGDADCPICFEDVKECPALQLTFCRSTCGANFHAECIRKWLGNGRNKGCPLCRQPWTHASTTALPDATQSPEGYFNLGSLQGQSAVRDTSTYHSPSNYNRRWRH